MANSRPLKLEPASTPVSRLNIKLPPIKWFPFTMHHTQYLGYRDIRGNSWIHTWKAFLLACGVPHDGSLDRERFVLSELDDRRLAVLVRTSITLVYLESMDVVRCVTAKPIFSGVSIFDPNIDSIEIVYPHELSKDDAAKFSVHGEPLKIIEHRSEGENEEEFVKLEYPSV
ncbi:hypothetical protein Daus18300_011036 [Diaporthe australafricana]|uniref:Uncharacterized protein n=1 Tax=Diaporthe australafricana TaxID=127596 RepID=A0ABR3W8K2_9PEZI